MVSQPTVVSKFASSRELMLKPILKAFFVSRCVLFSCMTDCIFNNEYTTLQNI